MQQAAIEILVYRSLHVISKAHHANSYFLMHQEASENQSQCVLVSLLSFVSLDVACHVCLLHYILPFMNC